MLSKRKLLIAGSLLILLLIVYFRWASAIRQPLEFSHAQHVKAQIPCAKCHPTPDIIPSSNECRQCHLEKNFPSGVQWIQVYRVAPDIIFSHTKHTDVPCSTCHEEFTSADRWIHEARFKMSFCMDCHEETRASNECKTCHLNR